MTTMARPATRPATAFPTPIFVSVLDTKIVPLIVKYLGNVIDVTSLGLISFQFRHIFHSEENSMLIKAVLKYNFMKRLSSFLSIGKRDSDDLKSLHSNREEFQQHVVKTFCAFLSQFNYCFSGGAVLASMIGVTWDDSLWSRSSFDVYVAVRPDTFKYMFEAWLKTMETYFEDQSYETMKTTRTLRWFPRETEAYLAPEIGRWFHTVGEKMKLIRFFFLRGAKVKSPKEFVLTCYDFTFLSNWIVITEEGSYSHKIAHVNHLTLKTGILSNHYHGGWIEDWDEWVLSNDQQKAQSMATKGFMYLSFRRSKYQARGFSLLGQFPKQIFDGSHECFE